MLETPITDLMDLGIYQENKDSPNSGVQCTYNIHHHFPPEVIEILRKLVDKI